MFLVGTDSGGNSPLLLAASLEFKAVVRILLEAQADVNYQESETGNSALTLAASEGRAGICESLLDVIFSYLASLLVSF